MKKTILLLAALGGLFAAPAAEPMPRAVRAILDTPPALPQYVYCEISCFRSPTRKGVAVRIDFGQEPKRGKARLVTDAAGREIRFDSVVDALHYMAFRGWEPIQFYTFGKENDFTGIMLRKPTSQLTEAQREALFGRASRVGEP